MIGYVIREERALLIMFKVYDLRLTKLKTEYR